MMWTQIETAEAPYLQSCFCNVGISTIDVNCLDIGKHFPNLVKAGMADYEKITIP